MHAMRIDRRRAVMRMVVLLLLILFGSAAGVRGNTVIFRNGRRLRNVKTLVNGAWVTVIYASGHRRKIHISKLSEIIPGPVHWPSL